LSGHKAERASKRSQASSARRAGLILAGAASLGLLVQSPATAQTQDGETSQGPTIFGRALSVSLQARVAPSYMGSDRYEIGPTGRFSLAPLGEDAVFGAPDDGASLALVGGETWSAGLSGRFRSKRDNDRELQGFDKVDWAVEAGAFASLWPTDWLRLRADVQRGFGGHKGWVAQAGADAVYHDDSWVLSLGPRARWGDTKFTRTYFGVTAAEAARSPFALQAYAPQDSVASAGVLASAEYRWSRRWSIVADAEYNRLLGDPADSPIVRKLGSADQFSAALGLRYAFGR
jgi:outer membrane protein